MKYLFLFLFLASCTFKTPQQFCNDECGGAENVAAYTISPSHGMSCICGRGPIVLVPQ